MVSQLGYGIAASVTMVYISIGIAALWGVYGASVQAFLTSKISPMEQGRLQGALGSMTATAGIFGPPLFSHVFEYSVTKGQLFLLPGTAMILASILITLSLIWAIIVTSKEPARIQN